MTGLKRTLRSRRGFTLVELIVVLVILGITASIGVPALTGYVDNAKEKQAVSEAQACVTAATDLGARQYALVQKDNINASFAEGDAAKADTTSLHGWINSSISPSVPNIVGDLALTEGSGKYYLHINNPKGGNVPFTATVTWASTTDGKAYELKSYVPIQAGVGGTVSRMSYNTSGQLLYLVYTSKSGIQVVYTNTGSTASVDSGSDEPIVVPKPDNTTPDPKPDPDPDPDPEPDVKKLDVTFSKVDASTQAGLAGAQLQILKDDTLVATFTSRSTGNTIALEAGSYTLRESAAPSGYSKAADIPFTITQSGTTLALQADSSVLGENSTIIMKDAKSRLDVPSFGDLRFTIADSYDHNIKISDIKFKLERLGNSEEFGTQACVIADDLITDESGTISIPVYNPASGYFLEHPEDSAHAAADYCMYRLTAISYPEGRQEVFYIQFQISPKDKQYVWNPDAGKNDIIITDYTIGADFSTNEDYSNYGSHIVDPDDSHHLTYFNKEVPYLTINLLDKSTGQNLSGSIFKITIGEQQDILTSSATMSCRIALRNHSGDNIKTGDLVVDEYSMITLEELASPSGYALMPKVTFQILRTGLRGLRVHDGNNPSLYAEIDTTPLTMNLYNLQATSTTIRKIDDARELLSGASLRLTTGNGGILYNSFDPQTSMDFSNFSGIASVNLQPGTYTLEETHVPASYTVGTNTYSYEKAPSITFTIEAGQTSSSISMLNHTVGKATSDITIKDDNVTILFPDATNWSKKLTQDDSVKINREVLFWQGKYYYCVPKFNSGAPNKDKYKQYFKDSILDLDTEFDLSSPDGLNQHKGTKYITPDPISYYKLVVDPIEGKNNSEKVVLLTEKVWTESSIQTVSATNPIKQGDLYVYNNRVYLYYGKADLNTAPNGKPDDGKTGNIKNSSIWDQLDSSKAEILTNSQ